jgi:large subunit ribosomal protein L18
MKPAKKSEMKENKTNKASAIGEMLAKKAQASGINKVVFDRGGYKYHGRVKALAEGLRKGGLKF